MLSTCYIVGPIAFLKRHRGQRPLFSSWPNCTTEHPGNLRVAPTFCVFRIPTLALSNGFSYLPSHRGYDVIPLCHCQSFFEVLLLCSHFSKSSEIWFLTSFQRAQWYNLCFSVPVSFFTSSTLLFVWPNIVVQSFLHQHHASLVFLRSIAWTGSSHNPSFSSAHCHSFQ